MVFLLKEAAVFPFECFAVYGMQFLCSSKIFNVSSYKLGICISIYTHIAIAILIFTCYKCRKQFPQYHLPYHNPV